MADEWNDHATVGMIETVLRKVIAKDCLATRDPLAASEAWAGWLKGLSDDIGRKALTSGDFSTTVALNAIEVGAEFCRFSDDLEADVAEAMGNQGKVSSGPS
jgi:hypothetical protein